MDPLRSAKSTVTCLRSPSRAVRDTRICSARCRGVYASGVENRVDTGEVAAPAMGSPHSVQNFADAVRLVPHLEQRRTRRAPHSSQNLACGAVSWPQREQVMASPGPLFYHTSPRFERLCPVWGLAGSPPLDRRPQSWRVRRAVARVHDGVCRGLCTSRRWQPREDWNSLSRHTISESAVSIAAADRKLGTVARPR